ncbi:hypothetical protein [Scleromatobacter humisilvae]|uniref:Uncharacterized protein n=1 Tax=Scleromatobacter humisilvae TaxID=2897159 RepID=A0A9X1YG71_9BURK|nr:hypothetical protein [Scleromatobacter humisilvae]MCK9685724.1 hypothetical protein [Scleromatobacter humisilvae]
MPTYPVHVPRKSYKGSDARKRQSVATRNELASRLERYINAQEAAQTEPHQVLSYGSIAMETGISFDLVSDILYSVDCGSGGLTMFKNVAPRESVRAEERDQ